MTVKESTPSTSTRRRWIRNATLTAGKLKIMGKREMQKLSIKSPDAPDALVLTFITEIKAYGSGVVAPPRRGRFRSA